MLNIFCNFAPKFELYAGKKMQRMLKLAENNWVSTPVECAEYLLHDELCFCFFTMA
jgi:hypothetical protein